MRAAKTLLLCTFLLSLAACGTATDVDDASDEGPDAEDFNPCGTPCPAGTVCRSLRCVAVADAAVDATRDLGASSDGTADAAGFDTVSVCLSKGLGAPVGSLLVGEAAEGFAVIREALKDAKKIGLGQMATRGRDQICAVRACGDGLLLETLRYASEVKDSDAVFDDIPDVRPDREMLSLPAELIKKKTHKFDPAKFKSHYATALRALINEKRKTGEVSHATDEDLGVKGQSNVIDLMAALRASVKGKAAAKAGKGLTRRSTTARKTSAVRKTAKKAAPKKKAS
mgnify:CR=1 FL=1